MEKRATTGPMLMPSYVNRFACTGGDCEDTCCSGWRIDLDRSTLLSYEASEDPELKPLFAIHVKRNAVSHSVQSCGYIEKLEAPAHYCPFLDEARLCRIQGRLGEDALCDTCANYPRTALQLGEFQQMTLQLSCPEAARLALLDPEAFDLEAPEVSFRPGGLGKPDPERAGLSLEAMEEVRIQLFQILLTRDLELSRRLAVLALFCQRLTELVQQAQTDRLPDLLATMDALVANGAAEIPLRPESERNLLRAQFARIFLLGMRLSDLPPHQRRVIDAATSGLCVQADGSFDEAAFLQGLAVGTARLDEALAEVPWLLEHYLWNEALRELLPWSLETPQQHCINYLLRFAILRVLLVGRAASQEALLTPVELAETVQVFCRRMQNGRKILDQINPEVTDGDWTQLGTLFGVA